MVPRSPSPLPTTRAAAVPREPPGAAAPANHASRRPRNPRCRYRRAAAACLLPRRRCRPLPPRATTAPVRRRSPITGYPHISSANSGGIQMFNSARCGMLQSCCGDHG
ncbi:serine/arginine repetitive matrix protein 1-like [Triticum dicoccoides]|uniref:serine/arginine repetitive matrix protein 1-like n=1 Tax=Triticum dicoccoides TaxID=85692 RepID=UPI00188FCEE9|nr:serine/arginine repetitive matrix protein 1-like [Triticum dicoccoides]